MSRRIDRSVVGNALVMLALAALGWWLLGLQANPWPSINPLPMPRLWAAIATALFLALCGAIAWRGRTPRMASGSAADAWLVVYASQTGFALELAGRTAQALRDAGQNALVRDISRLDLEALRNARVLFVASTTGEGDPPDPAIGFVRQAMGKPADLRGTRYAVLALGDREYAQFCAFGHQLDEWLKHAGATPLFDLVEVDNADDSALRHWQHHLGVLTGNTDQPDWQRPRYQRWTLVQRLLLNPGIAGGPAFHLALQPSAGDAPQWQAGDIAEIGPRNAMAEVEAVLHAAGLAGDATVELQGERMPLAEALMRSRLPSPEHARGQKPAALAAGLQPLPHREYSIASIPADGSLQLLVRLMQREDGSPGIGSGWLCMHAGIGDGIDLRLRANPNFHAPDASRPMILVGNGTGLAGLRAHIKARIAIGAHRNWLLFGERNAGRDDFHGAELQAWLGEGKLARLDRVYSRDGGAHRYVQDVLRTQAARLREWLDDGAVVYVCGSLQGMAPGVDAALADVLGQDGVDALVEAGRYRRDVY